MSGLATLNFTPPHAGIYNVTANFSGDTDYNLSTNSTIFCVAKLNTSLSIVKTVNNNNPNFNDTVSYTINVKNDGTTINSPVLVKDNLPEGLEYWNSNSNAGSYDHSTGVWTIPRLGSGETATLNIIVKCKSKGNIANTAFLVLNDYNNNGTNDSSVQIAVHRGYGKGAIITVHEEDTGKGNLADTGHVQMKDAKGYEPKGVAKAGGKKLAFYDIKKGQTMTFNIPPNADNIAFTTSYYDAELYLANLKKFIRDGLDDNAWNSLNIEVSVRQYKARYSYFNKIDSFTLKNNVDGSVIYSSNFYLDAQHLGTEIDNTYLNLKSYTANFEIKYIISHDQLRQGLGQL